MPVKYQTDHASQAFLNSAQETPRQSYAIATAFTFLLFTIVQIAAISKVDLITSERLAIGLILVVPTLLFTHVGIRLSRSINEQTLHRILLALFVAMEFKLVIDIL